MGVMEKIYETLKDLPEPLAREVLDFAEALKARSAADSVLYSATDRPHVSRPLTAIAGGLKQSTLFSGNPVDIQRQLRSEWQ